MKKQLPNILTILRVALLPFLAIAFHLLGPSISVFCLFAGIAITDFFDGYLARKWNVESEFGAFLDPAADKLLVCMTFILLSIHFQSPLFSCFSLIIIARELVMSMLREWCVKRGMADVVAVDKFGKLKTTSQMLAIGLLLLPWNTYLLGTTMLAIAAALTALSLTNYVYKVITAHERQQTLSTQN